MHTHVLLLASLLSLSRAWVPFQGAAPLRQHPWDDPTPRNLEEPLPIPTITGEAPLDATPSISYVPTMTTIPYPTSSPSSPSEPPLPLHAQLLRWIKRQGGAVTNPQAAQPVPQVTQVSPITTLTLQEKGKPVNVVYTQTFPSNPDQWPMPEVGTIGLGTIQGQIGVPKSKRAEPMEVLAEPTEAPNMRWQDEPEETLAAATESRSRRRGRGNRG